MRKRIAGCVLDEKSEVGRYRTSSARFPRSYGSSGIDRIRLQHGPRQKLVPPGQGLSLTS